MEKFEKAFVNANRAVVAGVLALVFGIVFINVLGRYGFGKSFAWVEEAARHLMVLGAFCGAGLALREGRLVAITMLADMLPPRLSLILKWLIVVIMAGFMGAMTWLGIEFVAFGWPKETMSTGMPRGLPYAAIPLGCGLFLVHLFLFARRFVVGDFIQDGALPDENGEKQA